MAQAKQFVAFALKLLDLAEGDFLELRDGADEHSAVLKNLTSVTPLPTGHHTSSGRFLFVKFKSDGQYSSKGFEIVLASTQRKISKS